ncbi:PDR/VanB family oxidoreductase [Vogesella facilis]|uniref:PDR/VanB family oxidoreductase n=1 Tax=Vogesella facilis TaxID=1655232 RepID=A0ABV7REP6_9NEIS
MSTRSTQIEVQVTCMRLEAEGVMSLELQAPDRSPLPSWTPGAHIDLVLPSATVRQYSLCGDPQDSRRYRIAVLLEAAGRGGSREVHTALRVGQRLTIGGPRNAFELQAADSYLFVAGGIGITPLLPMIRQAERSGAHWLLLYGGRARQSMAFVAELAAYGDDKVRILPADEAGMLDLDAIVKLAASGMHTYSCGPAGLLNALEARFAAEELASRLHIERFAAAPPAANVQAGELTVVLARSGRELAIPADKSILHALRDAGHCVPSSCEQGVCGMCETRVLCGEPDHRDMLLTEQERASGKVMMLCVSRARTPTLTLDL